MTKFLSPIFLLLLLLNFVEGCARPYEKFYHD